VIKKFPLQKRLNPDCLCFVSNIPKNKVELWSSVEYAGFGRALVRCLSARGVLASLQYEVGQKDYWEVKGIGSRIAFRFRAYVWYPLRCVWRFLSGSRPLLAVVSTNTFYVPLLAILCKRRKVRIVHWVLDLYPDVLELHGVIKAGGVVSNVLSSLIAFTIRASSANVFLGRHLLAHAESRFGRIKNARVIPVGADGSPFLGKCPSLRAGAVKILYSGNFGRMHDIETIEKAITLGLPLNVSLVFRSSGAGYRRLRDNIRKIRPTGASVGIRGGIEFRESLGDDGWRDEMLSADIALVTVRRGAEGVIMPSKTYSAMVAGQAILAIAPTNSDLAELVRDHNCGWLVEPGDVDGLIRTFEEIVGSRDLVLRKRLAAYHAGHAYFDQKVLADEWIKLLHSTENGDA